MKSNSENDCIDQILNDKKLRVGLARASHQHFFGTYFGHYIKCLSAEFHKMFFEMSENQSQKIEIILSFRQSAKSAIFSTSYPIWAITGKLQKKFVVLVAKTQTQARAMLENIKRELESNKRLVSDLGPFQERNDDFSIHSLYFPWYDAKIISVSMEQDVRGLRYKQNRPDLIIADDIENLASVTTQQNRDKVYNWVNAEILPLGQKKSKYIFIGNLLHEDSLIMRLKKDKDDGNLDARFFQIPLLNDNGNPTWPGLYPDKQSIETKRRTVPDQTTWDREYLLKISPPDEQIIKPKLIQYYDGDPFSQPDLPTYRYSLIAVDPAISKKINSANTSMLLFHVFSQNNNLKIIIDQQIINQKIDFIETKLKLGQLIETTRNRIKNTPKVLIESVGYQRSLIDELRIIQRIRVEEFKPLGAKDERLRAVAHLVEEGVVLFPRQTSTELVNQICYFYSEKYHDLADSLSMGLNYVIKHFKPSSLTMMIAGMNKMYIISIDKDGEVLYDGKRKVELMGQDILRAKERYYKSLEKRNDNGEFR